MSGIFTELPYLFLIMSRLAGLVTLLPVPGARLVPRALQALLVISFSWLLYLALPHPSVPVSMIELPALVCREFLLGLLVGAVFQSFLLALFVAGEMVGREMGLEIAALLDPSGPEIGGGLVGQLYWIIGFCSFWPSRDTFG